MKARPEFQPLMDAVSIARDVLSAAERALQEYFRECAADNARLDLLTSLSNTEPEKVIHS